MQPGSLPHLDGQLDVFNPTCLGFEATTSQFPQQVRPAGGALQNE